VCVCVCVFTREREKCEKCHILYELTKTLRAENKGFEGQGQSQGLRERERERERERCPAAGQIVSRVIDSLWLSSTRGVNLF